MNELFLTDSSVFGSEKALKSLSEKTEASILVISDSHGNRSILQTIITEFGKYADALIFCGDGIQDFLAVLDAAYSSKKLRAVIPPVAAFVGGNGDSDTGYVSFNPDASKYTPAKDGLVDIIIPRRNTITAAGCKILFTHGHLQGVYYGLTNLSLAAKEEEAGLVLFGHTHVPFFASDASSDSHDANIRETIFLNPGSCSLPRRNFPPSFAVVRIEQGGKKIDANYFSINSSILDKISFSSMQVPKGE